MKQQSKKLIFNIGLLFVFIWLLIISYSSSKRKPESVGELLTDFSWLGRWPKWLDLPLMKYINIAFKKLNESYGWIFEAINNFLLCCFMYYLIRILRKSPKGLFHDLLNYWTIKQR